MTGSVLYDVIVAGAGPAGVAAATVASQAGFRVCLLGETSGQQLKVGESLPGAALRLLRRLGILHLSSILRSDEFKPCVANASMWGSDVWIYRDAIANPEGGGFHILRHRFDAALLDHAISVGVDFVPAKLNSVSQGGGSHVLVTAAGIGMLSGRFVVDATGRAAAVSTKLGVRRKRVSEQTAAVGWFRHSDQDADSTTRVKGVQDGWWYTARLPQGLRVIIFHGLSTEVSRLKKLPDRFVEWANDVHLVPYNLSLDHAVRPIKCVDASMGICECIAEATWLAVGDAALSFDPLSSQGLLFALYSGIRGGETVIQCLAHPASIQSALSEYRVKVRRVFESNQLTRRLFYESERRFFESAYWRTQRGN
ncbi:MAG: tryptophan 7-halogenase [Nitrospira sp.]|nr:tryptophan 7-halogenase [Nitrospira sp.]MDH4242687.1 tryptophan 7-halogenase [Nitrospira sp.]MDH4355044.1 tryptophan 7-halogenase [Nitrospira sp.]MDH5316970.1 tryptophan 7-halogenase [Nitrospira sp.]